MNEMLLRQAENVFNTYWPLIAVVLGIGLGLALLRLVLHNIMLAFDAAGPRDKDVTIYANPEKPKNHEKPKRQLTIGADGELSEDWDSEGDQDE